MSVDEYRDWEAFFYLEPDDAVTQALYFGNLNAAIYNQNVDRKQKPEGFSPDDFYPLLKNELPVQFMNDEELKAHEEQEQKHGEEIFNSVF